MKTPESTALETVVKQDRTILVAGLLAVIALSWLWLLLGAGMEMDAFEMTRQSEPVVALSVMPSPMIQFVEWTFGYALLMVFMWWVMMVAMMLPSASPMLLLFAIINRKQRSRGRPFVPTGVFAAGYLIVWGLFSVIATLLQWALEGTGLLSSMMVSTSALLGGCLLLAAGAWQLTPIKQACLRHCRSPIAFLSGN